MNPTPLSSAISRAVVLAFVGLLATVNPLIVAGGALMVTVVMVVAAVMIVRRFARMTKAQRLDFIELVRALRQSGK